MTIKLLNNQYFSKATSSRTGTSTMIRLIDIILLAVLAAEAFSYDGTTIGQLEPPEVGAQLIDLLTNFFPDLKPNCSVSSNPQIDYYLYSRENTEEPIKLNANNPMEIDPRRKIVFLLHGWLSNSTTSGILKLKDEYIKRYNVHLIVIDWDTTARHLYTDAFCGVPIVGERIGNFMCLLYEQFKVRLYMVHVLGHGLGGQVLGYMGQHVISKCGQKMGRLTGLDPSRHLFEYKPESERLDKSDGDLVDVIHTDGMNLGYGTACGDVDFHPNCGYYQPGCPSLSGINNDTLVSDAMCGSLRSIEYMVESVESEDFIGVSCARCPLDCNPDIITEVYAIMGENYKPVTPPAYKRLNFFIPTNSTPPYAKGDDPYKIRVNKNLLCKNVEKLTFPLLKKVCNPY